jgi:hypothetical protein
MRLICLILLTILSLSDTEASVSGYKTKVRSIVFEDGSVSRSIQIVLSGESREGLAFKRQFLERNGYAILEKTVDDLPCLEATKLFVPSPTDTVLADGFARIAVRRLKDSLFYREEFFTAILTDEVAATELKNDRATAKVLLADTQFEFVTLLPGRILTSSSGDFHQDSTWWSYDIEQLFNNRSFSMAAHSTIAREEELLWIVGLIAVLMMGTGFLLLIKASRLSRLRSR